MVTVDIEPAQIHSVNRPSIFEVSTNRFGTEALAVTSVISEPSGPFTGSARFLFGVSHPYQVGDILNGTAFTVSDYNRIHVVVQTTATTVTTDIIFLGTATGLMTRRNNNYRVRADIGVFDPVATPKVAITAAAVVGVSTRFTTAAPHLLSVGDIIEHTETTTYDGLFEVESITDSTNYTVAITFVATTTGFVQHAPVLGSIRQQVTVENATNLWRFSVSGMLRAIISGDLIALGGVGITTPTPKSIKRYVVFFEEEYDLKAAIAEPDDRAFSSIRFALNNANQHRETQNVDRFLLDGIAKLFLNNAPSSLLKATEEEYQLSFITNDTGLVKARFERFDLNGASIGITDSASVTIVDKRGIFAINDNIFDDTHSKIEVWIAQEDDTQISEKQTFVRDARCFTKPIRFHFLNRPGGHDAFTFTGDFSDTQKSRKTQFQRDLGTTVEINERGKTTLGVADDPNFVVWSDILNLETRLWLRELIESPDVFLEEGDDLIPVIIENRSTRIDREKPTQISLLWREANERVVQNN